MSAERSDRSELDFATAVAIDWQMVAQARLSTLCDFLDAIKEQTDQHVLVHASHFGAARRRAQRHRSAKTLPEMLEAARS